MNTESHFIFSNKLKLGKFLVCLFITLGHVSIYWVFGIPAGLGTLAAVIYRSKLPLLLFSIHFTKRESATKTVSNTKFFVNLDFKRHAGRSDLNS